MPTNYDPYGGKYKRPPRQPDDRPPPHERGYDASWRRLRDYWIRREPVCQWPGCRQAAAVVDHVIPIRDDPSKRLDADNLQSLCTMHHAIKTARDEKDRGTNERNQK